MRIKKEAVAEFIRAITVAPVLVCVLILVLSVVRDDIFYGLQDIIMSFTFCFLFILPAGLPLFPVWSLWRLLYGRL